MLDIPLIDIRPDHWEIVRGILHKHVPQYEVWAFGSRAKWTAKPYSDLDLAVISSKPLSLSVSASLADEFSESDLPWKVDVVDWATTSASFRKIMERDKVVVQEAGWSGGVASGWSTAALGDLTVNYDGKRKPVKESDRRPGQYPYYGASGIVDYVDGYLLDGDYLLIAEDGENLRTRQTPIAFMARGKFWVNNHAHIVTGNDKADTRFLLYATEGRDISGYLTGAVMPKLTQGNLNKIELDCPPLTEQRAIAHILGSLDDKIELNRRMNETLEAMARALFQSWFVDFDPVRAKVEGRDPGLPKYLADLFPGSFKESEFGEIPAGWEVKSIGDLANVVGGTTPSTKENVYWEDGEHAWATPKDLAALSVAVLLDTEWRITDAGLAQIGSGLLPKGTVLLSSRAPIGYLAIAEIPVAINQGFIAMTPKSETSNLFLLFWASVAHEQIVSRANGSTFLEISKANFRPIPVVTPSGDVMRKFDQLARPLYERIVECARESHTLATLRDILLPKLISGELRVPDAERFLGEVGIA